MLVLTGFVEVQMALSVGFWLVLVLTLGSLLVVAIAIKGLGYLISLPLLCRVVQA